MAQIVKHSGHGAITHANDIAILKLKKSVSVDGIYVALASLPETSAGTPTGPVVNESDHRSRPPGPPAAP